MTAHIQSNRYQRDMSAHIYLPNSQVYILNISLCIGRKPMYSRVSKTDHRLDRTFQLDILENQSDTMKN
jgi:hypothetical protein